MRPRSEGGEARRGAYGFDGSRSWPGRSCWLQRRQDLRAVPARTLFGARVDQVFEIELAQPVQRERWTAVDGPASYAYATNHLIDVPAGIIVDVEATPGWRIIWALGDMA